MNPNEEAGKLKNGGSNTKISLAISRKKNNVKSNRSHLWKKVSNENFAAYITGFGK